MNGFLTSVGYDRWILPALLGIPLLGALVIWLQAALGGRDAGAAPRAAPEESAAARAGVDPRTAVDEIMVVSAIYEHAARLRSYELLAEHLLAAPPPGR